MNVFKKIQELNPPISGRFCASCHYWKRAGEDSFPNKIVLSYGHCGRSSSHGGVETYAPALGPQNWPKCYDIESCDNFERA